MIDLSRFVDAWGADFARALGEIEGGRKRTHWMWYIFPEVIGLGRSETARHYEITSVDEAHAFLVHPVLGAGYRQITESVATQVVGGGVSITDLFGSPDDSKLVSSLTLFAGVAEHVDPPEAWTSSFLTHAREILGAAYAQGHRPCTVTAEFLGAGPSAGPSAPGTSPEP